MQVIRFLQTLFGDVSEPREIPTSMEGLEMAVFTACLQSSLCLTKAKNGTSAELLVDGPERRMGGEGRVWVSRLGGGWSRETGGAGGQDAPVSRE